MRKSEAGTEQVVSDLARRLDEFERRLNPTPKLLEPHPVGSVVFSIVDVEARNPWTVAGYRSGRILVISSPDEPQRELPIASVVRRQECKLAQPISSQKYAHIAEPKLRAFLEGRDKAQLEAKTKPFTPPIAAQERYGPYIVPQGPVAVKGSRDGCMVGGGVRGSNLWRPPPPRP